MFPDLSAAVQFVRQQRDACAAFDSVVILGSGLGSVVESAAIEGSVPYDELAGFPQGRVPGHVGKLLWGTFAGRRTLFFQGRFHLYQGLSAAEVVAPVILAHGLGCRDIFLTNASGGIRSDLKPGDLVFVTDHLNLTGDNPLRGLIPPSFLDLSDLYGRDRFPRLQKELEPRGVKLKQGVLAALSGPSYETPAEIRMLSTLGVDLVSMSTVHEAIAAKHLGMDVTAISIVANPAAGLSHTPLSHQEVLATSNSVTGSLPILLERLFSLFRGNHWVLR